LRTELKFQVVANDEKLAKLNKQLNNYQKESKQSVVASQKLDNGMMGMIKTVGGLAAAYISFNVILNQTKEIVSTGLQFEALEQKLTFATGTIEKGGEAMQFIREESDRLGLNMLASADGFTRFAAAARGTSVEGQKVKDIFKGVSEASAVMRLSADETRGAFRAIEQIMSKGKVQAEELRGQLGERLPGAFQMAARAMNVTTAELNKMLEMGEVVSDEFLPAFGKELRKTFASDAVKAAESAQAAFNRFDNSILELKNTIAESGVVDFLADITRGATGFLNSFKAIESRGIRQLESDISDTTEKLAELQTEAEKSIMPEVFNFSASRAKLLEGELQRLLATYTKLIEKQQKTGDKAGEVSVKFKPLDTKELDKMSKQISDAYAKGLDDIPKDIWQQSFESGEKAFVDTMSYSVSQAVTDGLMEGDFSGFENVLQSATSSAMSAAMQQGMAAAGPGALVGIGIGAAVLGSMMGGGSGQGTKALIRALEDNEAAVRENTDKRVLEILDPEAAAALARTERAEKEAGLIATIESLNKQITEASRPLSTFAGSGERAGTAIMLKLATTALAQAQLDLANIQGDIAVTAAQDLVNVRQDETRAIEDQVTALNNMINTIQGTISMQDNFVVSQMKYVQSGGENLAFLEDELATKDALADATREAINLAGTGATPEMIAALARQEQDVVSVAGLLSQRATEVGGSSEEATRLHQLSIDTVEENMQQSITIEEFMLSESRTQTSLLESIDGKLTTLNASIEALPESNAIELTRSGGWSNEWSFTS
jgi:tape measure domain-containing protein